MLEGVNTEMDDQGKEAWIAFIAMALAALAMVILAAAVLLGCDGRINGLGKLEPDTGYDDPLDYSGMLFEGRWWRTADTQGHIWLNAWDDSTIEASVDWDAWATYGSPVYPGWRTQKLGGFAAFSLHVNQDSTVTSRLTGLWLRDSLMVPTIPMPESLGAITTRVTGTYSSRVPFYAGDVFDSTLMETVAVYDTVPGFALRFDIGAPKLEATNQTERLRRVGPHGEPGQELTAERPQAVRVAGRGAGSALGGHHPLPRPAAPDRREGE